MQNGKCLNCGSNQVFKSVNGIISGDKQVYVRHLSRFTPGSDKITYICTNCGYYANFIPDKSILNKITEKWEKVS